MSKQPAPEGVRVFGPYETYGVGSGGLWRDDAPSAWRLVRAFTPAQIQRLQSACEANTPDWAQYLLFNLDIGKQTERDTFAEGYAWDMVREFEARGTDNRIDKPRQRKKWR